MADKKMQLPARVEQPDGSVVVKLSEPVQFGSEELIEEIKIKKPKAKHLRNIKLEELGFGELLDIAGAVSGNLPKVMDELCWNDAFMIVEVIGDFLPDSERTGKATSQ